MALFTVPVFGQAASEPAQSSSNSSQSAPDAVPQKPAATNIPPEIGTKVALETSEPLFATLAAINVCGFEAELNSSDPVRVSMRNEILAATEATQEATTAREEICRFYRDKQQPDAARELAQYVSLAINLNGPPFALATKQADLPPDALNLVDMIPLLQNFYDSANLHSIWQQHQQAYEAELVRLHDPIARMIWRTDLYLKLPLSGYLGRKFYIYVEPMGAPGQVNARNYGADYFLVITPGNAGASLKMDQIRHTYLHYILDPLALKRANAINRLSPLLHEVANAPLDDSFKRDMSLMLVESFIRAVEARTMPLDTKDAKAAELTRSNAAQVSMEQGFILTRYFYDALAGFEKDTVGLRDAFGELLNNIDIGKERKRVAGMNFSAQAAPELIRASNSRRPQLLDLAEEKLSQGDSQSAHRIAQQVLDQKSEDPARALFILARAAVLSKDINGAQLMFERTLEIAKEPRTVAWSHIMLARILDLKCIRDSALTHYRAALSAGDPTPDTKNAAEKGINTPSAECAKEKDE